MCLVLTVHSINYVVLIIVTFNLIFMDEVPFVSNKYVLDVLINDFELRINQISSDSNLSPYDKYCFLHFYYSQISTLKTFLEHGKH